MNIITSIKFIAMNVNHSTQVNEFISIPLDTSIETGTTTTNSCIFVGDLGRFCTEDELFQAFSVYGIVLSIQIMKNKRNQISLGYGFVIMSSHEEAANAIIKLNGISLSGRSMKLDWGMYKKEATTADTNTTEEKEVNVASVYIKFRTIKVIMLCFLMYL